MDICGTNMTLCRVEKPMCAVNCDRDVVDD